MKSIVITTHTTHGKLLAPYNECLPHILPLQIHVIPSLFSVKMDFEPIPTIKLPNNFKWEDFPQIYFKILTLGLALEFGAAKFVLPDRMIEEILPNDLSSIRAKLKGAKLGKITAKSVYCCFIV